MNLFRLSRIASAFAASMTLAGAAFGKEPRIPDAYQTIAGLYKIPPDIFYAVALQESGRYDERAAAREPWPWTLNVEGDGYYYASHTEAWNALLDYVVDGRTNIGIGLMQVTWPYNQYALVDVYGALDPDTNLRLGAQVLSACYDMTGDWWLAVGCYHSPGSSEVRRKRATAYTARVKKRWERVVGEAP